MCSRAYTAAILSAAAGLAMGGKVFAQPDSLLTWNNAGGGLVSTTTNWNPVAMPAAADDLTFNLAGAYTVTFNSSVPTSRTQTYRAGTVTLVMSSAHTTTNGVTIGDLSGDSATASLATGSWSSGPSGFVTIGDAAGSSGTLNVNDDDADFFVLGSSDLFVGNNGLGTMNITGGGSVSLADAIFVGQGSAATGNLTVSGFVAQAPFPISRLDSTGLGQSRFGNGGDATVSIANGALAHFAGDLVIGNLSTSIAIVTVQGPGLVADALLDIDGDLLLGRNTTAATAAGAATLNINGDGRLTVGNLLAVAGDPDGGTATLHLASGGSIISRSFDLGPGATLDLDGGTLDIDGGIFSNTNNATLFIGGAQHPVVTMKNNAAANLGTVFAGRSLTVGGGAGPTLADFDVRSGSDLTISNGGDVIIGDQPDDEGSLLIEGTGSTMTLQASSDLHVGVFGDGRFEAELDADVTGQRLMVATEPGSTGFALFENPGTTAQFQSVFVGGDSLGSGGSGTLVVNVGAVLTVPTAGASVRVYPDGLADITSATMNVTGNMVVSGQLEFQGTGQLNVGTLTLDGLLIGHPNIAGGPAVVNGNVAANANSIIRAINGDLTLGDPLSLGGFSGAATSTIETGANTVRLLDFNDSKVGRVILTGGTLIGPAQGIDIVNAGTVDGTGTLKGPVFFNTGSSVMTATTAAGITIEGMLTNNSGTIDGTKFTFTGSGAGWTGAGSLNAKAQFDAGTTINALGNMTIGDNTTTGATFNGVTHLGTSDLTINDSNGCALGTLTDMDGGVLASANGAVVNTGRTLRGHGDVNVTNGALTVFGTIEPDIFNTGTQAFESVAELDVIGNYTQGAGSHYNCEVAGLGSEFERLRDLIDATGVATLNGAIHISFALGYTGVASHTFDVVEGSSRVGTFSQVTAPSVPFGPIHVVYLPDRARVVMCYANCDGSEFTPVITANDFTCFINRYASGDPYANCDGSSIAPVLTANDFQCFINKVANGCP